MKPRTGDDSDDGNLLLGGVRQDAGGFSSWSLRTGGASVFRRKERNVVASQRLPLDPPGGGKYPRGNIR